MSIYLAYGQSIETDIWFDALPIGDFSTNMLRIDAQRVSTITLDPGIPARPCSAQGRNLHIVTYPSYVTVQVDLLYSYKLWLNERRIECFVREDVPESQLRYWLLHQIVPLFLLLEGSTEFLHGMAVSSHHARTDDLPPVAATVPPGIAFLGESHAGKSTLLSYFLSRGHTLVTDDHLALSRLDYSEMQPATPFYRPYRAPEDLGIAATAYSPLPLQLERLYLLEPEKADAPVAIERLTGLDAVTELFPHLHYSLNTSRNPDVFPLVEHRFRGLASLAKKLPIARLHVPRSLDRLAEVYDEIQKDLATQ